MKLYEIAKEIQQIFAALEEGEGALTPEMETALTSLQMSREDKVLNLLKVIIAKQTHADAVRTEAERLTALSERLEKQAESCKAYLLSCVGKDYSQMTPIGKMYFSESVRCVVSDLEKIPEELWRNHKPSPALSDARKLLLEGKSAPGFELEKHYNLQLR